MTNEPGKSGIVELKKNIFQLSGANAAGACKAYRVKGGRKNLMIDTGLPSDAEAMGRQLNFLGLSFADIHIVVLTMSTSTNRGVSVLSARTVLAAHAMAANKIGLQDESC